MPETCFEHVGKYRQNIIQSQTHTSTSVYRYFKTRSLVVYTGSFTGNHIKFQHKAAYLLAIALLIGLDT